MTEEASVLLELKAVDKRYGDVEVLRNFDLAVRDREFMTVLGPSGSGKTTVLRLIGGFTEPTRGKILLDGRDIAGVPINRRPFNTVFQDYALFPHLTVEKNVGYGLMVRGLARPEIRARVGETLKLVALEEFAERYPAQLSGGQRQRAALARAIICQPRLILLDEPLGALDAALRRQMQGFLKRLQKDIRTTFLFVTHDQEEAVTMADRICVMNKGSIVQIGTPHDIYYRPDSEYVARFFGDNNLIEGTLGGTGGRWRVTTPIGEFACAAHDGRPANGTAVKLVVRPEAIRFAPLGADCDNHVRVRVDDIGFVGALSQVTVRPLAHPDIALMVKLKSRVTGLPLGIGAETDIGWSAEECRIVST